MKMLLSDKALDLIAIISFIVVIATCIRFEKLESESVSKDRADLNKLLEIEE